MLSAMNWSQRARAEGRIHEMSWADKAAYLVKYLLRPETSAPPSVRARFGEQAPLRRALPSCPEPALATLGFLGDLMWIRRNWGEFLAPSTLARLRALDGLVGNLETVVSRRLPVNEFWPDLFLFNSDARLLTSFSRESGKSLFAALSFANNHTLDHGDQGARDTLALLASLDIPQSGIGEPGSNRWVEFSRGGIRFGFYAATFGLNDQSLLSTTTLQLNQISGIAPDHPAVEPDLGEARESLAEMEEAGIEVKILCLHWGHEFEFYPTDRLMKAGRDLVSAGADIIVGSHPHVPQPPEILLVNGYEPAIQTTARVEGPGRARKGLVFYSLGNFASAMFTPYCRLATLWPISFHRGKGGVDWQLQSPEFFYNRSVRGGRELLPLSDYALPAAESRKIELLLNLLRID
jgi:poly-gamma-glutamate synthesis protein (capsule biosynthesis protein)